MEKSTVETASDSVERDAIIRSRQLLCIEKAENSNFGHRNSISQPTAAHMIILILGIYRSYILDLSYFIFLLFYHNFVKPHEHIKHHPKS